jgi:acyl-CoA synthetase (AMP-forming)/AMP-acid ligase II
MEPAERRRPATPRSSNSSGSTATPKGVAITHQNLSGTSPPSLR